MDTSENSKEGNPTYLMYNWADLTYAQRLEASLLHIVIQTQVKKLKLQTNESFMEEQAIPSYETAFVLIQSLQLLENFYLWKIFIAHCHLKDKLNGNRLLWGGFKYVIDVTACKLCVLSSFSFVCALPLPMLAE